ncbi:Redoxin-domain-containing protein [Durotheca rogersii]|uniref:Redoxin-domain-containing protein n=1 Tax=Durotheca rogersii TaxID=419775 RepID=UPI0022201694|nr:Redoxin-domain-containing protein [Durotheca rogersii]KAI5863890.1 Redoxin-domain-containing protein [Durotheca rogersii]
MAFRAIPRRAARPLLPPLSLRGRGRGSAAFHASAARAVVQPGDALPDLAVLHEGSPGTRVSLGRELGPGRRGLVVGVPAAFSGACSQTHVPGYLRHPRLRDAGRVFVVSVNDAFVMKAWGDQLDPTHESGVRFLADPSGAFTRALDLGFDGSAIFGGMRGRRYALVVDDGRVRSVHVEPDNTGTDVSLAEKVLGPA